MVDLRHKTQDKIAEEERGRESNNTIGQTFEFGEI